MDCPPTTGFDTKLRICNYIKSLPRCNDEGTARLLQHQFDPVVQAKQTRTNFPVRAVVLDAPKVGYLTSSNDLGVEQVVRQKRNTTMPAAAAAAAGHASAGSSATYKLLTCHVILLATISALLF